MTFQFGGGNVSLSVCVAAEWVLCGFRVGLMVWMAAVAVGGDRDGGGGGDGGDSNNENNEKQ
jgi:hypothetical protein